MMKKGRFKSFVKLVQLRAGRKEFKKINYACPFCKFKFIYFSRRIESRSDYLREKHGGGSNQVVCPQCGNFVKTWSENVV